LFHHFRDSVNDIHKIFSVFFRGNYLFVLWSLKSIPAGFPAEADLGDDQSDNDAE
jgi:hypothetical protein